MQKEGNVDRWAPIAHAYVAHRRREAAMLVPVEVSYKLAHLGIWSVSNLRDMANAFCCTEPELRRSTMHVLVPPPAPGGEAPGYRAFFEQKFHASIIKFVSDEGVPVYVNPGCGNIVGSSEGPALFAWAYNNKIGEWLAKREETIKPPKLELVHLRGTRLRGDRTLFADDSNTRLVLDPQSSLQDQATKLAQDDQCFDEVMAEGGWKQNKTKADILPNFGG